MNYYALSAFFNGLLALFLVYYVFLRNRQNELNRSFLYFGISVAGWSLIYAFWVWQKEAFSAERFIRFHMTFCAFIPATYLHFTSCASDRYSKMRWVIIIAYLISGIYATAVHTPLMIAGVKQALFFDFWPMPGPWLLSFVLFYALCMGAGLVLLSLKALGSYGAERRQTLFILMAFVIGVGGGSMNWFLWFDIEVPPQANWFVGVTFGMIAYAIVRYGFMDVDRLAELMRENRVFNAGLLVSSINHEIKNPLYIIKGLCESALSPVEELSPSEHKGETLQNAVVLKKIHTQADRASNVMRQFAEFVRPKKRTMVKEVVNLSESLSRVIPWLEGYMSHEKIDLNIEADSNVRVWMDAQQVEEVMFNLLVNACQALKETRGAAITVEIGLNDTAAIIEVRDNGCGISKDQQTRLFKPFQSNKADGTGLGLYITKQLVERNGGKITVSSALGKGTVFKVILPTI